MSNAASQLTTPEALATEIIARKTAQRMIVAIVGAPGSGKSTLAEAVRTALTQQTQFSAEVVPMDGYHYDNAILDARGWRPRKGAPHTFDVDGFASVLERLRRAPPKDVAVPVFDRERDLSAASARIVSKDTQILLVEGNYLLLDREPWDCLRPLFDVTVKIECARSLLQQRLMARWLDLGMPEATARHKVDGNDLPNADLVETACAPADLLYSTP